MFVLKVVLKTVGKEDHWTEEWKGKAVQELDAEEAPHHIAAVLQDWNRDHPNNQRELSSFVFEQIEDDSTPEEDIVDAIIADLSDRRGLRHEWDQIDDDIKEEIRSEWIEIVKNKGV